MEPRAWGKEGEQAAEKYVYAPNQYCTGTDLLTKKSSPIA